MLFGKLGRLLGSLECLGWVLPEALVTSGLLLELCSGIQYFYKNICETF